MAPRLCVKLSWVGDAALALVPCINLPRQPRYYVPTRTMPLSLLSRDAYSTGSGVMVCSCSCSCSGSRSGSGSEPPAAAVGGTMARRSLLVVALARVRGSVHCVCGSLGGWPALIELTAHSHHSTFNCCSAAGTTTAAVSCLASVGYRGLSTDWTARSIHTSGRAAASHPHGPASH